MRLMRHTFSKENGQHLSRILCHTLKIYILKKNSCRGIDQIINFCFSENIISLENTKYFSSLLEY